MSLPAPTPTELAAIRARLERRSWPGWHIPRTVAGVSMTPRSALAIGGLALVAVALLAGSSAVAGCAMSLFQAGLAVTWLLDDSERRAADRAVVRRLREGIRPTLGRRRRLGPLPAAVALLVGCAQLATVLLVASALSPAPVAAFAAVGPLLLLAVHVVLVRRDLRMPGVTGTPVLDAVDAALARSSVAGRIRPGAPLAVMLVPVFTVWQTLPDPSSAQPAAMVAFVAGGVAFELAGRVLRQERPLLEDPRLTVVTPATPVAGGRSGDRPPLRRLPPMSATSLPATPTELAAVRARLQRRAWPNRQVSGSGWLVALPIVPLAAGLVLVVVATVRDSDPLVGLALSLMHAGVAGMWLFDDAAARAADRAVTERLRLDGLGPSARRHVRLGALTAAAAALLTVSQAGTTALVVLRVVDGPFVVLAGLGPLLLLATHLLLVRRGLTAPGVTGTAMLDAVDVAVLRTDLAARVRSWAPFGITAVPLLMTLPDTAQARPIAWVVFVTGLAALGCAELVRRRESPLVDDPRQAVVTPATSWLAGSPATVHPSGGSPT